MMDKYAQQFFDIYSEKLEALNSWTAKKKRTPDEILRFTQIVYSESVDEFFEQNNIKMPWKKYKKYEKIIQDITKEQETFVETMVTASVVLGDFMKELKEQEKR